MKKTFTPALCLLAALSVLPASRALAASHDHGSHAMPAAAAQTSDGEVRNIDKAGKRITLKHGELKNLGMPPMTMVFQVKDASLLDKVKVGNKVKFVAAQEGNTLLVTAIEVAK